MSRRRALGSGLDALISGSAGPASVAVRQISVDAIRENRSQPRTQFDEQALEELAASIREHGLIQPIIVSEDASGGYELIAGERRWRASRRAGLREVPALVKSATPQQMLELALIENIQRADLNALEEGLAYQTLKDEFGLSDELIAQRVGKSRVAVVNARRLIRLIPPARQAIIDGTISAGHGRALLRFEDAAQQQAALDLIVQGDLNVRESERLGAVAPRLLPAARAALFSGTLSLGQAQALLEGEVASEHVTALGAEGVPVADAVEQVRKPAPTTVRLGAAPSAAPRASSPPAPDDREAQRMFEGLLETPVQLARNGGAIKLTITFYSDDQIQGFYDRLTGGLGEG